MAMQLDRLVEKERDRGNGGGRGSAGAQSHLPSLSSSTSRHGFPCQFRVQQQRAANIINHDRLNNVAIDHDARSTLEDAAPTEGAAAAH